MRLDPLCESSSLPRAGMVAALALLVAVACSSAPAATPLPVPSGAVVVRAADVAFEPREVTAPAGGFELYFDNRDTVPHDASIRTLDGERLHVGEIFSGPAQRVVRIEGLEAGTYVLFCSVHPGMEAAFTVR